MVKLILNVITILILAPQIARAGDIKEIPYKDVEELRKILGDDTQRKSVGEILIKIIRGPIWENNERRESGTFWTQKSDFQIESQDERLLREKVMTDIQLLATETPTVDSPFNRRARLAALRLIRQGIDMRITQIDYYSGEYGMNLVKTWEAALRAPQTATYQELNSWKIPDEVHLDNIEEHSGDIRELAAFRLNRIANMQDSDGREEAVKLARRALIDTFTDPNQIAESRYIAQEALLRSLVYGDKSEYSRKNLLGPSNSGERSPDGKKIWDRIEADLRGNREQRGIAHSFLTDLQKGWGYSPGFGDFLPKNIIEAIVANTKLDNSDFREVEESLEIISKILANDHSEAVSLIREQKELEFGDPLGVRVSIRTPAFITPTYVSEIGHLVNDRDPREGTANDGIRRDGLRLLGQIALSESDEGWSENGVSRIAYRELIRALSLPEENTYGNLINNRRENRLRAVQEIDLILSSARHDPYLRDQVITSELIKGIHNLLGDQTPGGERLDKARSEAMDLVSKILEILPVDSDLRGKLLNDDFMEAMRYLNQRHSQEDHTFNLKSKVSRVLGEIIADPNSKEYASQLIDILAETCRLPSSLDNSARAHWAVSGFASLSYRLRKAEERHDTRTADYIKKILKDSRISGAIDDAIKIGDPQGAEDSRALAAVKAMSTLLDLPHDTQEFELSRHLITDNYLDGLIRALSQEEGSRYFSWKNKEALELLEKIINRDADSKRKVYAAIRRIDSTLAGLDIEVRNHVASQIQSLYARNLKRGDPLDHPAEVSDIMNCLNLFKQ